MSDPRAGRMIDDKAPWISLADPPAWMGLPTPGSRRLPRGASHPRLRRRGDDDHALLSAATCDRCTSVMTIPRGIELAVFSAMLGAFMRAHRKCDVPTPAERHAMRGRRRRPKPK